MCVKWGAWPSGQGFNTSRGASFTFSLDVISCLWAGPRGESVWAREPSKGYFLDLYCLIGLENEPHWFSKLDVLGAHLSSTCLKGWDVQCGIQTLHYSERNSEFESPRPPPQVWVTTPGVRFMVRWCPSFFYTLWFDVLLVCLVCNHHSASL